MKVQEVREVFQSTDIELVNQKLKEGFTLLKILSTKTSHNGVELCAPSYVLGKGGPKQ